MLVSRYSFLLLTDVRDEKGIFRQRSTHHLKILLKSQAAIKKNEYICHNKREEPCILSETADKSLLANPIGLLINLIQVQNLPFNFLHDTAYAFFKTNLRGAPPQITRTCRQRSYFYFLAITIAPITTRLTPINSDRTAVFFTSSVKNATDWSVSLTLTRAKNCCWAMKSTSRTLCGTDQFTQ